MVATLGLIVNKCPSQIKAVNSKTQSVLGRASGVPLEVGEWKGKMDFLLVPLNDLDIILDNEFFVQAKAGPIPFLRGLLVINER